MHEIKLSDRELGIVQEFFRLPEDAREERRRQIENRLLALENAIEDDRQQIADIRGRSIGQEADQLATEQSLEQMTADVVSIVAAADLESPNSSFAARAAEAVKEAATQSANQALAHL